MVEIFEQSPLDSVLVLVTGSKGLLVATNRMTILMLNATAESRTAAVIVPRQPDGMQSVGSHELHREKSFRIQESLSAVLSVLVLAGKGMESKPLAKNECVEEFTGSYLCESWALLLQNN